MLDTLTCIFNIVGVLVLVLICTIFPYLLKTSYEETIKVWEEIEKLLNQKIKETNMSRSLYYLVVDLLDETQELKVVEESSSAPLSLDMNAKVLATYSVDNSHDFGSIRIEDSILDMYEADLTSDTGINKIADFYYSKKDLNFKVPSNGDYDVFIPKNNSR